MTLAAGTCLGPYEIIAAIGAGGMGEVYRARDTRLGREVALKLLPAAFASDPERVARFEREARLLASLNHPNIAHLYGFETATLGDRVAVHLIAMELAEGEDLARRLERGPIPLDEAIAIARQIAEALEEAHEKGIVHRDLKPANVKVTEDGVVKVLDFGLAKAWTGDAAASGASATALSQSPTLAHAGTAVGLILGTAAYMAPEQAKGKAVDRRADIWAFGLVLYEMLTGRPAFSGDDISETLASVLKDTPDFGALPPDLPASLSRLLRRVLEKDPRRRLGSIGDARLELDDAASGASETSAAAATPLPRSARWKTVLPWSLAAILALAAAVAGWRLLVGTPVARSILRFAIMLPSNRPLSGMILPAVAVSPDGSRLVYIARDGARDLLYVRSLDQFDGKPIVDTEGAYGPFFSPDGQWIGFFASGKLKKISLNGGTALTLWDSGNAVNTPLGGTWGLDDTIVFSPGYFRDLSRVSASGGAARQFVSLAGARSFQAPQFLPGGKAVLVTAVSNLGYAKTNVSAVSLDTGQQRVLVEGAFNARYAATGHLVYTSPESLMAVPFDPATLELKGTPSQVLEGMSVDALDAFVGQFSLSDTGTLAYVPGDPRSADQTLVWIDRKGQTTLASGSRRNFEDMALSPDGQRVALTIEGPESDVWVFDVARDSFTRLTFGGGNRDPMWTPDGKRVVFNSTKHNDNMLMKSFDGSGSEERLLPSPNGQGALSWPSDGKALLFQQRGPGTGNDLWVLPFEGDKPGKPRPFVQTPAKEEFGSFSPDGRWVAYESDESGRFEVYVRPYPGPGGKSLVSTDGGIRPRWAQSGRELFYRNGDKLMSVDVTTQPQFTAGRPRVLFEAKHRDAFHDYGVTPDGQRFMMIRRATETAAPNQIHIVLNWFDDLKQRLGGQRK